MVVDASRNRAGENSIFFISYGSLHRAAPHGFPANANPQTPVGRVGTELAEHSVSVSDSSDQRRRSPDEDTRLHLRVGGGDRGHARHTVCRTHHCVPAWLNCRGVYGTLTFSLVIVAIAFTAILVLFVAVEPWSDTYLKCEQLLTGLPYVSSAYWRHCTLQRGFISASRGLHKRPRRCVCRHGRFLSAP